ncbi:loganic acid O-methyltransferase-like [Rosa rugosa]|uniref:loganic acid O-methyltransferase-like n=1 Tax=Rosa rugosa TaxID=74645 RepID=UPI002B40736C|nr:loganic acid O-methyltransferase-like [Rosa rugosa]
MVEMGPTAMPRTQLTRGVVGVAKELLNKAILEKLDIDITLLSNTFHIADPGCSVGPNTFYSVENILEAVQSKYQIQGQNSQIPEFQVFFNDHAQNDFNMLFKSIPQNRQYFAVGVPGSFHGRLFPKASIHIVHTSYAIQWLSRVPEAVVDSSSSAWNKGRIHYSNSTDEVIRAHETQYSEDMECFLHSRAQEIMYGGLMILMIPGRPDGTPHSHSQANMTLQFLGSCLMDMAGKGDVSEEKVDSFNIPMYTMSPQELKTAVEPGTEPGVG